MTRDRVDGLRVSGGLLPHVQPDEREAERRDTPQHVGETAVGNDPVAGRLERPVAEPQRLGQRVRRLVDLRRRNSPLRRHAVTSQML